MNKKAKRGKYIILRLISGNQVEEQLLNVPVEHGTEIRLHVEVHEADILACAVGHVVRYGFTTKLLEIVEKHFHSQLTRSHSLLVR